MFKGNTKAIMGIGTLIIFIATILVAAVAAGVIISTSGILQQKALQVGDQTRSRLVNGIDVEQIFLHGNLETEFNHTANDFEILIRPSAGSNAIQLKTVTLTLFAGDIIASAVLENPYFDETNVSLTADIDDTGWTDLGVDLDGDGQNELAMLSPGTTYDYIQFNVTSSPQLSVNTSLRVQLDGDSETFNVQDIPIRMPNGSVWGYLHINGTDSQADTIEITGDAQGTVTGLFWGDCSHDKLIPDSYYCYRNAVGNGDTIVEFGETMFLFFRLSQPLYEGQDFEIRLLPSGGRTTLVLDSVPEVIDKAKFSVFP